MKKQLFSLLLALSLTTGLAACGGQGQQAVSPTPDASPSAAPAPSSEPSPEPSEEPVTVHFAALAGPTGVGAAKLLADSEQGKTANDYETTVAADNSEISAKLISGDLDIACMASNVAANLYNKSEGGIQALCLSTLGVLYILERGEKGFAPTVASLADLKGQTLYATGQGANPEYVLNYLLSANGLDPASDVEVVWQSADEVRAAMLTGDARFAMLPVPAATTVLAQAKKSGDRDVQSVLDLTEEWDKVTDEGVLTMTTVVARTAFAEEHPQAVEDFLTEYAASIDYVTGNVDQAAELVERFGIVPSAAIAKLAIPQCNLVYIDGEDMRSQIQGYYQVLYAADPASIGGGIPDDGFYYGT